MTLLDRAPVLHRALVLGIGSAHGDDSIGWHVVDQLSQRDIGEDSLRRLTAPMQIIEYLAEADQIHIVDAAKGLPQDEHIRRLEYPHSLENVETLGTHGFGISETLALAQTIGKPVDHVIIWLAKGESFEPMSRPSPQALTSIQQCAAAIEAELT